MKERQPHIYETNVAAQEICHGWPACVHCTAQHTILSGEKVLLLEACRIPCTTGSSAHCKTMQTAANYLVSAFVHDEGYDFMEDKIRAFESRPKDSHNDKWLPISLLHTMRWAGSGAVLQRCSLRCVHTYLPNR